MVLRKALLVRFPSPNFPYRDILFCNFETIGHVALIRIVPVPHPQFIHSTLNHLLVLRRATGTTLHSGATKSAQRPAQLFKIDRSS